MAKSLIIKGYTSEEIKAELKKHPKCKIGIKLHAIYQVSLGKSSRELSELYGFSFKQIVTWVHQFEESGIDGLKEKKGKDAHPNYPQANFRG